MHAVEVVVVVVQLAVLNVHREATSHSPHSHDDALRLTPPPPMTLESAIEFIAADELVEVTPGSIRMRKRLLSVHDRRRERGRDEDLRRSKEREAAEARGGARRIIVP